LIRFEIILTTFLKIKHISQTFWWNFRLNITYHYFITKANNVETTSILKQRSPVTDYIEPFLSIIVRDASRETFMGWRSKWPTYRNVKMSKCQNVKMPKCQNAKMPKCQNVKKFYFWKYYVKKQNNDYLQFTPHKKLKQFYYKR
jgi:hypothetical protein